MEKCTKDYDIFKKHENNRNIYEKNVVKLMQSIQQNNMLHLRPILVDEHMKVVDGQHRLEAAKRLGIPIYYQIEQKVDHTSIFLLNNNHLKWNSEDYLNYYCSIGNENYILFKRFINKHSLSISVAYTIIGKGVGGKNKTQFREGGLKFPDEFGELDAINKVQNLKKVIEYIKPKILGMRRYLDGPNFCRAFCVFLNVKNVDFDVFMKKLPYRLDLIRPCSRIGDFLNIFREIYNFKNHSPIREEEIKDQF